MTVKTLVQYLYATSSNLFPFPSFNSLDTDEADQPFKEMKGELFSRILARVAYPQAQELLAVILVQCRNSRDSLVELDWKE